MLKCKELINDFVSDNVIDNKASNLKVTDNQLINYNTVIAIREGKKVYLNNSYYSRTTSKNQNLVKRAVIEYNKHCYGLELELIEVTESELQKI